MLVLMEWVFLLIEEHHHGILLLKKLKKLKRFDLRDGKSFALNTDATNLNAEQRSLISTLFSNAGFGGPRSID